MKKSKYLAMAIPVVLILVIALVACGQQAQVPEEPSQEVQQAQSVNMDMEQTVPPIETEPQEDPKASEVTDPVEVKESDPVEESAPVEPTPAPTPVPTEVPSQKPTTTKAPEVTPVPTTPPAQQNDEDTQPTQAQQPQGNTNKAGWNQAFYDTLNDKQKAYYESLTDAGERFSYQKDVEADRQLDEQGYTSSDTKWHSSADSWADVIVGGG